MPQQADRANAPRNPGVVHPFVCPRRPRLPQGQQRQITGGPHWEAQGTHLRLQPLTSRWQQALGGMAVAGPAFCSVMHIRLCAHGGWASGCAAAEPSPTPMLGLLLLCLLRAAPRYLWNPSYAVPTATNRYWQPLHCTPVLTQTLPAGPAAQAVRMCSTPTGKPSGCQRCSRTHLLNIAASGTLELSLRSSRNTADAAAWMPA